MKRKSLTFRNGNLPTLVGAGVALTFGVAMAQEQSGNRYSSDNQRQSQSSTYQGTTGTGGSSEDGYSIVVWDPVTGSWTYVSTEEAQRNQNQTGSSAYGRSDTTSRSSDYGQTSQSRSGQSEQSEQSDYRMERSQEGRSAQRSGRSGDSNPYSTSSGSLYDRGGEAQDSRSGFNQRNRGQGDSSASQAGRSTGQSQQSNRWRDSERGSRQSDWRESFGRDSGSQQAGRDGRDSERVKGEGSVTLEGTVQGFREVNLRRGQNLPEEHTWVRIQMESGYDAIVDLGRQKELSDLEMSRGDRIKVSGQHASIGGEQVLLADRIRVENETINIDRKQVRQSVSGKVRDVNEINLDDDEREDHLVVRLEMENGREVVADLGKDASLDDLEIERDAEVKIEGQRRNIDGRPVLVARKIKVEGDSTRLRDRE